MDYVFPRGDVATISIVVPSREVVEQDFRVFSERDPRDAARLKALLENCSNDHREHQIQRSLLTNLAKKQFRISLVDLEDVNKRSGPGTKLQ